MTRLPIAASLVLCCAVILPGTTSAAAATSGWRSTECATGKQSKTAAPKDPVMGADAKVGAKKASIQTKVRSKPATSLGFKDLRLGEGVAVKAGDRVTVLYCGVGQRTGKMFDSTYARGGQSITFPLSGLIRGWQDGISGMKPGGVRLLVVPASQAYGSNPPPGSGILPGETLVFTVNLVK